MSEIVRHDNGPRAALLKFPHGLGDTVQLTCVIRHFKKYRPDWSIDVLTSVGKDSILTAHCRNVFTSDAQIPPSNRYEWIHELGWYENYNAYSDCPSTKVTNCLRDEFGLDVDASLLNYEIGISLEALLRASQSLEALGIRLLIGRKRYRFVLVHHKGNTSQERKNLTDIDLVAAADVCAAADHKMIVLDWDSRTSEVLASHPAVIVLSHTADPVLWKGYGTGDGETIAALARLAVGCVGIDSGPGHVFGASGTPTVIVWTKHHPTMFYDLCPNVVHLVPENHRDISPAHHDGVFNYFRNHYEFRTYRYVNHVIAEHVAAFVGAEPLQANPMTRSHMLKATSFHTEYYDEHRRAGLDYLGHGEWQELYSRWLVESLALKNANVLDVGCACGSIAYGLQKAGARAHGVDLNNHMIRVGLEKFPVPLYVCDTINLHLFGPDSFALVHSNQVGEHWKKELVPFILREQFRVLKPGGLNFCVMDTSGLFERQKRDGEAEDPTNGCIESLGWWHDQFRMAGYRVASGTVHDRLTSHPESFFRRYDWDWVLYQKPE